MMSSNNDNDITYDPSRDGVDHCNVYTRGATPLGRAMSNMAESHIDHPRYGHFRTLEGLWYFLKTGKNDDMFRILDGFGCKKRGKEKESIYDPNFQREFKVGIICKILTNDQLRIQLTMSSAPFVHYYFYGKVPGKQKLVVPKGHEWQMEFWDSMRQHLKAGRDIQPIIDDLLNFNPVSNN
jgi:hypothetical protein